MPTTTSEPAGGLVFACVAPHGGLAIPEACDPAEASLAAATQGGMAGLAQRARDARPDVLVVLTPHGIHVSDHFAVVTAGALAGALDGAQSVSLEVPVDRELALDILAGLHTAGIPTVGVSYGGNSAAESVMPLDWGTLIPLWYLGGREHPPLPVVVVAPARDRPVSEHMAAGALIADAARSSGRRVGIVASADQAHTHRADGPYGFSPRAAEHDRIVVEAVRGGRLGSLQSLDPALVGEALPDSWWQMLMLAGAIGDTWTPEVLSYEAPTYFGMLCAAFTPPAEDRS